MKESKKDKAPRPNLKNKAFVQWSRAENCKKEDNIVSTDWHEKLKRLDPFAPVYDNKPLNMVYLLSGEYGRIWMKERDEWYKNVFVRKGEEADMEERRKKVRQKARAAKKAAEIKAKERKARRAKELEEKAKAAAEEAERVKERVKKLAAPKLPVRAPKKKKEVKVVPLQPKEDSCDTCPKGWKPVELTLQCECSDHINDQQNEDVKEKQDSQTTQPQAPTQGCNMCEGYIEQLQGIHEAKVKEKESSKEEHNHEETA